MKNQNGFTLIETLIYLALFAIVIGGSMVAVYQIIQSTEDTSAKVMIIEEANFLEQKVGWALSGATSASATTNSLSVTNPNLSGSPIVFTLSGNNLVITRNSTDTTLNNSFVTINKDGANLFTYDSSTKKVEMTFLVNNLPFKQTTYIY